MNYLEDLITEWLKYKRWLILDTRKKVGGRNAGGYDGELDVVALSPEGNQIWHIECSMDADPWMKREERFKKKFALGQREIPLLYPHLSVSTLSPDNIKQTALFGSISLKDCKRTLAGKEILLVKDLLSEIATDLTKKLVLREAVPEDFPILRTIQYMLDPQVGLGLKMNLEVAQAANLIGASID